MKKLSEGDGKYRITTCKNCHQRATDQMQVNTGRGLHDDEWCWFCKQDKGKNSDVLSDESIPLNLDPEQELPAEQRLPDTEVAKRKAWQRLQRDYPASGLSIMEEALISRVTSCVSVLQLPGSWVDNKQYSQLGYKGSVINFVSDLCTVAAQLPRAPKDAGIIVYVSEGVTKHGDAYHKLCRVRRAAIERYLYFFAEHHQGYQEGIVDPSNPSRYVVPPFTTDQIDEAMLASLPRDGVPEGIPTRKLASNEGCGADQELHAERDEDQDDEEDEAEDNETEADARDLPLPVRELHRRPVVEPLLGRWIQESSGPVAQNLRAKLNECGIDPSSADGLNDALCLMHGVGQDESRRTNELTIEVLARRLHELNVGDKEFGPAILADELVAVARSIDAAFEESGVAHGAAPSVDQDPMERLHEELQALLQGQEGTDDAPFKQPARGTVPISEFRAKGYISLAFPTLFPFGRGDYGKIVGDGARTKLTWKQWSQHLMRYEDCRFATHNRFPYFLLNTHEREVASRQSGLFVKELGRQHWTVGDLRRLSQTEKEDVVRSISKFSATLRNTPGFFKEKRKELAAMCDQLGDPHVFATTSHADTYCPYLHTFIKTWAGIKDDAADDPDVDCKLKISSNERYKRRCNNLTRYPHIVATFFHLKMELYVEHICKGILGANAWWMRYECTLPNPLDLTPRRHCLCPLLPTGHAPNPLWPDACETLQGRAEAARTRTTFSGSRARPTSPTSTSGCERPPRTCSASRLS